MMVRVPEILRGYEIMNFSINYNCESYFFYCITVSILLLSVFDVRSTIGEIVC